MFESIGRVAPRLGDVATHHTFDDELDELLDTADELPDERPRWVHDPIDEEMPLPSFSSDEPSGWMALELDHGTADEARLTDTDLIEAIIGFDRLASWAAARQARLLTELTRRRPPDGAAHVARTAAWAPTTPAAWTPAAPTSSVRCSTAAPSSAPTPTATCRTTGRSSR